MGNANAFAAFTAMVLVREDDNPLPVLHPDRARGLEARRGKARELIEENAAVRVDPAFRHELKATPRPPPVRYHDTTHECQSIEGSAISRAFTILAPGQSCATVSWLASFVSTSSPLAIARTASGGRL